MSGKSNNGNSKVLKTLSLNANVLGKIREVEQSMAADEAAKLENCVPEGHPLRAAIEEQKAVLGGDLQGLPPGHPLLRALSRAKETYEQRQDKESDKHESSEKDIKVRRAKRLDEAKARKLKFAKEEDDARELRGAASDFNRKMDNVITGMKDIWQSIAEHEEVLCRNQMNRAKITRLKRLLMATERGFSGIKMNRG